MPWQMRLPFLLRQPVGVSLADGTGVSGILCSFDGANIYLMEYLYHTQFATKHYRYSDIQNIMPFPPCQASYGPLY